MQLFFAMFALIGLAQVQPLISAIALARAGDMKFPDLCWKILAVTGALIPGLLMIAGLELLVHNIKTPTHNPKEPWMANPMWAAKHIRLHNRGLLAAMVVAWSVYLGIAVPFALGTEKTPFLVFFGALGLVLLIVARMFWLNRKWNTAELRMAEVPGVVGGPFAGVAILQQAFPAGTTYEVRLKCLQTHQSSGDGAIGPPDVAWSFTIYIDKTLRTDASNRTMIPFSFAIPIECHPTSDLSNVKATQTTWNLVVKLKDAINCGEAVFMVPIYRTSKSRAKFQLDEALIEPFQETVELDAVLRRFNMKRRALPSGNEQITFTVWNGTVFKVGIIFAVVCLIVIIACFLFIPLVGASFAVIIPGIFLLGTCYAMIEMLLGIVRWNLVSTSCNAKVACWVFASQFERQDLRHLGL